MTARLLIPPTASYEEWKTQRAELSRAAVTASEIAVLLGISPYDSPFNLYWRKLGEIPADYDDDAMSLGRHLEPWIADHWADDHPDWFVGTAGLWASADRPWQLCTPDRLLFRGVPTSVPGTPPDPDESLLEIKSSGTYDGWGEDGTDQIPAHYRAQVLWQLDTLGLREVHVTCFFLATRQRRDYTVAYHEADVMFMRDAALAFLDMVRDRQVPPVDHHPATTAALRHLNPKLDEDATAEICPELTYSYRQAKRALDDAQETYDLLTNEVRAAMGPAKRAASDGQPVATRSIYQVAESVRAAYTVDKITPAQAKKEAS